MIISFAWTTPALLAGAKTMTRRDWTDSHAKKFTPGLLVDAWDRSPRTKVGHKVATIRVTAQPRYVWSDEPLPPSHYEREGFDWLSAHGEAETVRRVMRSWTTNPRMLYVVEFELVSVESVKP